MSNALIDKVQNENVNFHFVFICVFDKFFIIFYIFFYSIILIQKKKKKIIILETSQVPDFNCK